MRETRNIKYLIAALVLTGLPAAAHASDTKGYLYGTVESVSGTKYEGRLRWGREEAFWTDHFNASKEERPLTQEIPQKYRRTKEDFRILGIPVGVNWKHIEGRQLIVRFGDLKSLSPRGSSAAFLVLKNGEEVEAGDGSNDIGARITVWDASLGEVQLEWKKIRRIDFKQAPPGLTGFPARLFGTVRTTSETLKGFIQWDKEECLATDLLEGEGQDGKLKIEMGKIKSIERQGKKASAVSLKDGRQVVMSGSNDVDSDNRGIFVDDPRYGRVLVSWEAFERLDFEDSDSGPSYDSFPALGPLKGAVTTTTGLTHKGRIVYDVDEGEGWEILDGQYSGLTYSIPFSMVASVNRLNGSRVRVSLRGGTGDLKLEDTADVTDRNAGVFVLAEGKKTYVPWEEVKRIDFEP